MFEIRKKYFTVYLKGERKVRSIKIRCLNLKWYPVSFTSHFRVERVTVKLFSGVSFDVFQFSYFFFWATQDSISIIGLSLKTHRSRGSCRHSSPSAAHQRARFCENEKAKQLVISCLVAHRLKLITLPSSSLNIFLAKSLGNLSIIKNGQN